MIHDLFAGSPESGSIADASQWIGAVFSGSIPTAIAIIAVAMLGIEMMSGRLSMRRSMSILAGCFILLGSSMLAGSLMGTAGNAADVRQDIYVVEADIEALPRAVPAVSANPFDPNAANQKAGGR